MNGHEMVAGFAGLQAVLDAVGCRDAVEIKLSHRDGERLLKCVEAMGLLGYRQAFAPARFLNPSAAKDEGKIRCLRVMGTDVSWPALPEKTWVAPTVEELGMVAHVNLLMRHGTTVPEPSL